jgi:carbon-monoxide dehydrogenase large subunit
MGPLTGKFGIGFEASGSFDPTPPSHPNGSHSCEVEMDPETGEVRLVCYQVVDDLGRVLNPMIVRGQIQGGVAQGIGQALLEHQVYDRQSGQLITGSFQDYAMPRAHVMPEIDAILEEVPCKTNALGVKGIGESGTIGAPPAVINALLDALRPHCALWESRPSKCRRRRPECGKQSNGPKERGSRRLRRTCETELARVDVLAPLRGREGLN